MRIDEKAFRIIVSTSAKDIAKRTGLTPADYTAQTFVWGYNIANNARLSINEYTSAVTEKKSHSITRT